MSSWKSLEAACRDPEAQVQWDRMENGKFLEIDADALKQLLERLDLWQEVHIHSLSASKVRSYPGMNQMRNGVGTIAGTQTRSHEKRPQGRTVFQISTVNIWLPMQVLAEHVEFTYHLSPNCEEFWYKYAHMVQIEFIRQLYIAAQENAAANTHDHPVAGVQSELMSLIYTLAYIIFWLMIPLCGLAIFMGQTSDIPSACLSMFAVLWVCYTFIFALIKVLDKDIKDSSVARYLSFIQTQSVFQKCLHMVIPNAYIQMYLVPVARFSIVWRVWSRPLIRASNVHKEEK